MDIGSYIDKVLMSYGLPGVIIVVLGWVVIYLYKDNKRLTKDYMTLMETRLSERLETQKELTEVMSTFSQSAQMLVDKIVPVQRRKR